MECAFLVRRGRGDGGCDLGMIAVGFGECGGERHLDRKVKEKVKEKGTFDPVTCADCQLFVLPFSTAC